MYIQDYIMAQQTVRFTPALDIALLKEVVGLNPFKKIKKKGEDILEAYMRQSYIRTDNRTCN